MHCVCAFVGACVRACVWVSVLGCEGECLHVCLCFMCVCSCLYVCERAHVCVCMISCLCTMCVSAMTFSPVFVQTGPHPALSQVRVI